MKHYSVLIYNAPAQYWVGVEGGINSETEINIGDTIDVQSNFLYSEFGDSVFKVKEKVHKIGIGVTELWCLPEERSLLLSKNQFPPFFSELQKKLYEKQSS